MPLILQSSDMNVVKWWLDASFAIHRNIRSHTGGVMTLGSVGVYTVSTKHNLSTRSSTEIELVSLHDVMPQIFWTRYFLPAQGH